MDQNLKEQLKLSLETPHDQHAALRQEFEDAFALMLIEEKYHQLIKDAAKKKRVNVKKFIEGAVMSRLARYGAFKK